MAQLVLVRGLPGSGKSTEAKKIANTEGYFHFEADHYFISPSREYKFDKNLLRDAHKECFENTYRALLDGADVVVSNTFTTNWELYKYIQLGDMIRGVTVSIIEMTDNYGSIHGVPEETLENMKARWEVVDPIYGIEVEKK